MEQLQARLDKDLTRTTGTENNGWDHSGGLGSRISPSTSGCGTYSGTLCPGFANALDSRVERLTSFARFVFQSVWKRKSCVKLQIDVLQDASLIYTACISCSEKFESIGYNRTRLEAPGLPGPVCLIYGTDGEKKSDVRL